MQINISDTKPELGKRAAARGAQWIREAQKKSPAISIVVATGASQFEMLSELVKAPEVDWSKITAFHLDEYVGLPESHPASFRKFLRERLVNKAGIRNYHFLNGEGDPYYTDGEIDVATLVVDGVRQIQPPVTLPPPPLIALKDQIWHGVSNAIGR